MKKIMIVVILLLSLQVHSRPKKPKMNRADGNAGAMDFSGAPYILFGDCGSMRLIDYTVENGDTICNYYSLDLGLGTNKQSKCKQHLNKLQQLLTKVNPLICKENSVDQTIFIKSVDLEKAEVSVMIKGLAVCQQTGSICEGNIEEQQAQPPKQTARFRRVNPQLRAKTIKSSSRAIGQGRTRRRSRRYKNRRNGRKNRRNRRNKRKNRRNKRKNRRNRRKE